MAAGGARVRTDIWQRAGSDREDCSTDGGSAAADAGTSSGTLRRNWHRLQESDAGDRRKPGTLALTTWKLTLSSRAKVSPKERARAKAKGRVTRAKGQPKGKVRDRGKGKGKTPRVKEQGEF